jgi:hypothetical protein
MFYVEIGIDDFHGNRAVFLLNYLILSGLFDYNEAFLFIFRLQKSRDF